MENNSSNKNLDDKIKESLSKYLASKEASDWTRMETMLDSTTKASSFKWSYIMNAFIGLVVLGGAYLVYTNLNVSSSGVKTEITTPNFHAETPVKTVVSNPATQPTETNSVMSSKNEKAVAKEKTTNNVLNSAAAENIIKTNATKAKNTKQQQIFVMGNEPVFGDMLDSTKGIVGETKENEETKKAALENSDKPIGWDKIINEDSLKKLNEEKLKNPTKDRGPK